MTTFMGKVAVFNNSTLILSFNTMECMYSVEWVPLESKQGKMVALL